MERKVYLLLLIIVHLKVFNAEENCLEISCVGGIKKPVAAASDSYRICSRSVESGEFQSCHYLNKKIFEGMDSTNWTIERVLEHNTTRALGTTSSPNGTNCTSDAENHSRARLLVDTECIGLSECDLPYEYENIENCDYYKTVEYFVRFSIILLLTGVILTANLATFVHAILKLRKPALSNVTKVHSITILNLSSADFVTGLYLTGVVISSHVTHSACDENARHAWLHSLPCSLLAAASLASSNISTTALILITSVRMLSVLRPYKKISVKPIAWIAFISWIIWFVWAAVPLFDLDVIKSIFVKAVRIKLEGATKTLTYDSILGTVNYVLDGLNKTCNGSLYELAHVSDELTWPDLISLSRKIDLHSADDKIYYYGYYVHDQLCYVEYCPGFRDKSAFFTLFNATFNILSFLYIVIAYIVIVRKSSLGLCCSKQQVRLGCCIGPSDEANRIRSRRDEENRKANCKIFLITLTNMMCILPMSIASVLNFFWTSNSDACAVRDYEISINHLVGVLAPFAIPINSFLNPFIYSAGMWRVPCKGCRDRAP
ncbi:unnamed protein product [Clavelina lepadiformis]|uniref:G-protein coupled receptors family 1 profile domain-containing protein n=1 Tax=Clavelina lepadiformis TaxID=159417 RepID=A0ABP0FNE5_CLALP